MSLIGADTFKWEDIDKRQNIMYRMPRNIKFNDNIVVREDEMAVFFRDGKALAYIDRPDRYALTSLNAPIVGKIVKFLSGVQQQAEVVYLQKRVFDGKFGSKQAYQFRDKEFGMVNLRVFGEFRYKIAAPENFVNQFVGTFNFATSAEVEDRIKEQMVILIYDSLGDMKNQGMGVADIASNLTNIEQVVLTRTKEHFDLYGITIDKLSGLYISLPEEVQKAVDTKSSMTILGANYMQYQTGQAMRDAAVNPAGGAAAAGVGVGAGIGMGWSMVGAMTQPPAGAPGAPAAQPAQVAAVPQVACPKCGTQNPANNKFCASCGAKLSVATVPCPKCKAEVPEGTKFCPECGTAMVATKKCAACGVESPATSKFCAGCGKAL
ncbi:MAG: SPFH domain-containing protein [Thermoplasmatota archaeon]|nr:SPFH domain-containing protein [Candidatus Thermoplasmatota archaeon]MBU1915084.1 SPFH domain-containing protein [Candidatus Thermoplasmatota archaeon]